MNIFISHSINFDYINKLYLPLKSSSIINSHKLFFPHDQSSVINTKEIIQSTDLMLAEVSISATGQGVELGWANAFDIPIICFHESGTVCAGSVKFIAKEIFQYNGQQDLLSKITSSLSK